MICRRLGFVILALGFLSAAWIWHLPDEPDDAEVLRQHGVLAPGDSAKYQHQVEIYYGKTGLLMDSFLRRAAQLSHGKPLAETVAAVSMIGAGGCFLVGAFMSRAFPIQPRAQA